MFSSIFLAATIISPVVAVTATAEKMVEVLVVPEQALTSPELAAALAFGFGIVQAPTAATGIVSPFLDVDIKQGPISEFLVGSTLTAVEMGRHKLLTHSGQQKMHKPQISHNTTHRRTTCSTDRSPRTRTRTLMGACDCFSYVW